MPGGKQKQAKRKGGGQSKSKRRRQQQQQPATSGGIIADSIKAVKGFFFGSSEPTNVDEVESSSDSEMSLASDRLNLKNFSFSLIESCEPLFPRVRD